MYIDGDIYLSTAGTIDRFVGGERRLGAAATRRRPPPGGPVLPSRPAPTSARADVRLRPRQSPDHRPCQGDGDSSSSTGWPAAKTAGPTSAAMYVLPGTEDRAATLVWMSADRPDQVFLEASRTSRAPRHADRDRPTVGRAVRCPRAGSRRPPSRGPVIPLRDANPPPADAGRHARRSSPASSPSSIELGSWRAAARPALDASSRRSGSSRPPCWPPRAGRACSTRDGHADHQPVPARRLAAPRSATSSTCGSSATTSRTGSVGWRSSPSTSPAASSPASPRSPSIRRPTSRPSALRERSRRPSGAYLVLFPRARVLSLVFLGFFYQLIEVPALIVLGFWFVLQLIDGSPRSAPTRAPAASRSSPTSAGSLVGCSSGSRSGRVRDGRGHGPRRPAVG